MTKRESDIVKYGRFYDPEDFNGYWNGDDYVILGPCKRFRGDGLELLPNWMPPINRELHLEECSEIEE